MARSQRQPQGFDALAARTPGFGTIDCAPHVKSNPSRGPAVPHLLVSTFTPTPPSVHVHLPMWPDMFGHHRAACAVAGVLGRRGFPLEVAAAQVCREAGARVSTNLYVRDMDLAEFNNLDGRRLEVVADGLTLWQGAQLATDTTLVSPLRRDGSARPRAADHNGAALEEARRRKERTYPELSRDGGRARLVVLAAEGGGRWSIETANFLVSLAKAKALASPFVLQGRVQQAYIRRWSALLASSAVRAFTASLLDRRPVPGLGDIPSVHKVVREARSF